MVEYIKQLAQTIQQAKGNLIAPTSPRRMVTMRPTSAA